MPMLHGGRGAGPAERLSRRRDAALAGPRRSSSCGERAGVEELLHQRFVGFGDHLDQRFARGVDSRRHVGRHGRLRRTCRSRRSGRRHAFIATRSTTPRNAFSSPIGSWIGMTVRLQSSRQRDERAVEAGALAIHPVQHDDARQAQLVGRLPDLLGRDHHAGDGVDRRRAPRRRPAARRARRSGSCRSRACR